MVDEPETAPTQTGALATFVERYTLLEEDARVLHMARWSLLDWVGGVIAGLHEPASDAIIRAVQTGDGVWDAGWRCLLSGTAGYANEFEQTYEPASLHISAVVWPAIASMVPRRGVSLQDAFAAFVAAYEVTAKVGLAADGVPFARGWHPTALLGPIGAAAAAGRLYGLRAGDIARAMGIAAAWTGGTQVTYGTPAVAVGVGKAAWLGALAARLTRSGLRSPDDGLDHRAGILRVVTAGEPVERVSVDARGAATEILRNGFKAYPCARLTHTAIEGVLQIRGSARHPETAEEIHVMLSPAAQLRVDRASWADADEARYSVQYCLARAWHDGEFGLRSFPAAGAPVLGKTASPPILVNADPALPRWGAEVRVRFRDGSIESRRILTPLGSPDRPLNETQIREKFYTAAAFGIDRATGAALEGMVFGAPPDDAGTIFGWLQQHLQSVVAARQTSTGMEGDHLEST